MATVRAIVTDALIEIGVLEPGDALSADQGAFGLLRFQQQLDSWAADRLTLARQLRTTFTLSSGTSSVTIGQDTADVTMDRPLALNTVNYVNPGSSPTDEVPIAPMDQDTYAALSIKGLSSSLPTQYFYQQNVADANGTIFFWPQVDQDVTIVLYTPQGIAIPVSLNTDVTGPYGYAEAFMYQLALRLCRPFGVPVPGDLVELSARATKTMNRPNVQPGLLSVDPALTSWSNAGAYNVLSDQG